MPDSLQQDRRRARSSEVHGGDDTSGRVDPLARNSDPALQTGPDALTFAELDEVSRGIPVFVLNASGSRARHS